MRLPQRKKTGEQILASDWNLLLDAIDARTPRQGVGLKFTATSGGFSYSAPPPLCERNRGQSPFSVIAIEIPEGGGYKVTIKEGWVIDRRPKTADHPHVKFIMPAVGGVTLDTRPRPQIDMVVGDILWCRYRTDESGLVTGTPEILVNSAVQNGAHYYPKDPASPTYGGEGDFYVKLFKIILDSDGFTEVIVYQQSDIEHYAQLWTGENLGDGAGVFKKHDEDTNKYQFRTLDGRGEYEGDSPDDGTSEQIKVVTDTDCIRVIGNGKKGAMWFQSWGSSAVKMMEWNDGQVLTSGEWVLSEGQEGFSFGAYTP